MFLGLEVKCQCCDLYGARIDVYAVKVALEDRPRYLFLWHSPILRQPTFLDKLTLLRIELSKQVEGNHEKVAAANTRVEHLPVFERLRSPDVRSDRRNVVG